MRLDVVPARSFDGSSPVSAYWLANCEGFRVRHGRRRGVVVDVAIDEVKGRAEYVVVRFGLRRVTVGLEDVDTVVPARELMILRPRERRAPRVARAARRARDAGTRSARAGGRAARRASAATAHAGSHAATASARETERFAAWAAPRLVLAANAFGRALAAGAYLVALGLTAAGRTLRALAVAGVGRIHELRAGRAARRADYESTGRDASSSSTSSHSTAV